MTEIRLELFSDRKPSGMKRTKRLAPGGPIKRSKPMNKVSTQKQREQSKAAKLLYCDSFGVPFADVRKWLWGRTADWKTAYPIKKPPKNPAVCRLMHELSWVHNKQNCWLCGIWSRDLQAHHVVSRWDFHGNICMCCPECHERVQHAPAELPGVLRAMQKNNQFLSWVHLIRARGSHFEFETLD